MLKILITNAIIFFSSFLFASTSEWQWAIQSNGGSYRASNDVVTDNSGNVYITGYFTGHFELGSYELNEEGRSLFIAKIDSEGNCIWLKHCESIMSEGQALCIDNNGNIYITGYFYDSASFGEISIQGETTSENLFIAKLDSEGNYLWATTAICNGHAIGKGITIDEANNLYVTGYFRSSITFGNNSFSSSSRDTFVAKLDLNGDWVWANVVSGNYEQIARGISIDNSNNTYITGSFESTAVFDTHTITSNGGWDIFISKLDINGNFLWATKAGGSELDISKGIITDESGSSYITGSIGNSAHFGNNSISTYGDNDLFIAKIDKDGNHLWVKNAGGNNGYSTGVSITIDQNLNSYVTGYFDTEINFDEFNFSSNASRNLLLAKLGPNGNWLWARTVGITIDDDFAHISGFGISIDEDQYAYISGFFKGNTTLGSHEINSTSEGIFVTKFDHSELTNTINENIPLSQQICYPNPAKDVIYIDCTLISDIKIFNLSGNLVLEENSFTGGRLDVSQLIKGSYYVLITNSVERKLSKIIIE